MLSISPISLPLVLALAATPPSPPAAGATSAKAEPAAGSSDAAATAAPPLPTDPDQRFLLLLDREWEWQLRDQPTEATALGDRRYDDKLPDLSPTAIERRKVHQRDFLKELQGVDRAALSEANQLNYDLALRDAELDIAGQRFPSELLALNQLSGVHTELVDLEQTMPRRTARDFDNLIARFNALPKLVDDNIALLRRGLKAKITPPKVTLTNVGELIANQIVDEVSKSPVYQMGFASLPDTLSGAERGRLQKTALRTISEKVMPALKKFRRFVVDEYMPYARSSLGTSALPDGPSWYAYRVKRSTTTSLSPDQIHQLGLDEVARIRLEMKRVMAATGFRGSMEEFFTFLRTDPRFFYTDKTALIVGYRDIAKRIDPGLPGLFGRLPRLTYGVRPVPSYSEKTQTTAYYSGGSSEVGRPGWFNANTYDLKTRPKWEMETLTLHEAVPGHHLQIALAQELADLPKFRRHGGYTAFVEGWALYGESLGDELGMFQDPYSKFGQLTYEMWRAVRLVVDTGIHAKGWTRDQAIDFFRKNAPKTQHDIEVEVDRYIVWPGQALAYKLGQLKIRELRKLAEKRLGAKFDVRAFHDVILGGGPLPLDVLETRVNAWLDGKLVSAHD